MSEKRLGYTVSIYTIAVLASLSLVGIQEVRAAGPNDIATGYNYTSTINFKSVLIPKPLPGGQSKFELVVGDKTFPLEAGKKFSFAKDGDFPDGVNAFSIRGIDLSEKLDAANMGAFPTGLSFVEEGTPQVKMVPIVKQERAGLSTGWYVAGSVTGLSVLALGVCFVTFFWRRSPESKESAPAKKIART